jgi:hypothetical protein
LTGRGRGAGTTAPSRRVTFNYPALAAPVPPDLLAAPDWTLAQPAGEQDQGTLAALLQPEWGAWHRPGGDLADVISAAQATDQALRWAVEPRGADVGGGVAGVPVPQEAPSLEGRLGSLLRAERAVRAAGAGARGVEIERAWGKLPGPEENREFEEALTRARELLGGAKRLPLGFPAGAVAELAPSELAVRRVAMLLHRGNQRAAEELAGELARELPPPPARLEGGAPRRRAGEEVEWAAQGAAWRVTGAAWDTQPPDGEPAGSGSSRPRKRPRRRERSDDSGVETDPRGTLVAGLLRAERAAWLALNMAARHRERRDGWLAQEIKALEDAREATGQALGALRDSAKTKTAAGFAESVLAAVGYWRDTGHLEVPQDFGKVEGKQSLGTWLAQLRPPVSEGASRPTLKLHWAKEPLHVLGLRLYGATGARKTPAELLDLADKVREADNDRIYGNGAEVDAISAEIDGLLERVRVLRPEFGVRTSLDQNAQIFVQDPDMLSVAIGRWRAYGGLDPQSSDPADADLDDWLESMRLGSPPPWLRRALGALGLDWRGHRLPQPSAPADAGPPPAGPAQAPSEPEELAELERGWRRRDTQRQARAAARQDLYRQLTSALGITLLDVPGDGNCFYASLLMMFRDRLATVFGAELSIDRMRTALAGAIQADFNLANAGQAALYAHWFPGTTIGSLECRLAAQQAVIDEIMPHPVPRWNSDTGDLVSQIAADLWALPITLLGQRYPVDIGPEGPDRADEMRYLVYTGDHYLGAAARVGDRVFSAAELQWRAQDLADTLARLEDEAPADPGTLERNLRSLTAAFATLQTRFTELTEGSPAMLGSWSGQNALTAIGDFHARAGSGLSQDTVDRLGTLYVRLRDAYLAELELLDQRAQAYLVSMGLSAEHARDPLIAVLAENRWPHLQDSPDWEELLARGRDLFSAGGRLPGQEASTSTGLSPVLPGGPPPSQVPDPRSASDPGPGGDAQHTALADLLLAEEFLRRTGGIENYVEGRTAAEAAMLRAVEDADRRVHAANAGLLLGDEAFVSYTHRDNVMRLSQAIDWWRERMTGLSLNRAPDQPLNRPPEEMDWWLAHVVEGTIIPEPWIWAALGVVNSAGLEPPAVMPPPGQDLGFSSVPWASAAPAADPPAELGSGWPAGTEGDDVDWSFMDLDWPTFLTDAGGSGLTGEGASGAGAEGGAGLQGLRRSPAMAQVAGVPVPQEAPSLEGRLGSLLRAERAARVALRSATRLEQPPAGWLERGRQAVADAATATDLALVTVDLGGNMHEAKLLVNLRAAVQFWRAKGHLEVPYSHIENVDGKDVGLGGWIGVIRMPKSAREARSDARWARQALNVMGMRWRSGPTGGKIPQEVSALADLVLAADTARIAETLGRIRRRELLPRLRDEHRRMLQPAFDRWQQYGTLDGDPFDELLENIRLRLAAEPPSWLQAFLTALGLSWSG